MNSVGFPRLPWVIALSCLLLLACRESPEAAGESPAEESSSVAEQPVTTDRPAAPLRLDRAGLIFGVSHPEGMELVDRTQASAQFVTTHSLGLLMDFYDRELTHYRTTEENGAVKLETPLSDRPDIFILPLENGSYRVTYFRKGLEEDVAIELGLVHEQLDDAVETGGEPPARGPAYPLGPMAPAGWEAEVVPPEEAPSLYEERFIEQDGETIRVLVPRNGP